MTNTVTQYGWQEYADLQTLQQYIRGLQNNASKIKEFETACFQACTTSFVQLKSTDQTITFPSTAPTNVYVHSEAHAAAYASKFIAVEWLDATFTLHTDVIQLDNTDTSTDVEVNDMAAAFLYRRRMYFCTSATDTTPTLQSTASANSIILYDGSTTIYDVIHDLEQVSVVGSYTVPANRRAFFAGLVLNVQSKTNVGICNIIMDNGFYDVQPSVQLTDGNGSGMPEIYRELYPTVTMKLQVKASATASMQVIYRIIEVDLS